MSAPRIAIDGLWRCLCPSFDSIALSRARVPVRKTNPRPCIGTRSSKAVLISSTTPSSRRHNSSTSPIVESTNERSPPEIVTGNALKNTPPRPRKPAEVPSDKLTTEELHDLLRKLRDEQGAYQRIIDLVQYLIRVKGEKPNLRHFDALIRANADAEKGSSEVVEGLLREMDKVGIIGDSGLYHGVLMTLAVHPNHLLRAEILEEMKARWISISPLGYHHLIISHLRDREYELALSVLSSLHDRTISVAPWLYDILIYVLSEAGELSTALSILQSRAEDPDLDPIYPDPRDVSRGVWPYFLDICAAAYYYPGVAYVWRKRVEIEYLRPSDGTLTNILNTAALAGDPSLATNALKMLAGRKGELPTSSYEALLEAYAVAGDVSNAVRVLCIMGKAGGESASKTPGAATTRPLFKLLRENGDEGIRSAWEVLRALQEEGKKIPVAAANVVLEAAALSGNLDLAVALYKSLCNYQTGRVTRKKTAKPKRISTAETANLKNPEWQHTLYVRPDTTTINILIQGCTKSRASGNRKSTAMYFASEMARQGIKPDELTYDRLILVCLDEAERDYEDAFRYLEEMTGLGWREKLRTGTWHALARRCARERDGRVEWVVGVMEELGMETGKLRKVVVELWAEGPGEREIVDERPRDDVRDVRSVDGQEKCPDDPLVWANLRRKPDARGCELSEFVNSP